MPFQKGNKGKPVGAISKRAKQWDELSESIIDCHAGRFNQILGDLMESNDTKQQIIGCEMFLQALEYFKPKQARVQHTGPEGERLQIVIGANI